MVVRVCAPRIRGWKGDILEGVTKCWVGVVDAGMDDEGNPPVLCLDIRVLKLMPHRFTGDENCA